MLIHANPLDIDSSNIAGPTFPENNHGILEVFVSYAHPLPP